MKWYRFLLPALASLASGCGHSDSFTGDTVSQTGPLVSGADVRLTYNGDQDYWPTWTEDSTAILYAFVPAGRADHDRCIGLVRPEGGTQLWQFCDERPGHADSTDSFSAFALGNDGRLIYQEITARIGKEVPDSRALWLADSAHPLSARKLLDFPVNLSGTVVDWLGNLAWTGPTDFIGLATEYVPVAHCRQCSAEDSAFVGKFVVRGHITAAGATLTPIAGTQGANEFALAENGNSVIFSLRNSTVLFGVAAAGGPPTLLGSVGSQSAIAGIACRATTCVIATDQVTTLPNAPSVFPDLTSPHGALYRFVITTNTATLLRSNPAASNSAMYASPLMLRNGTDVLLQSGGIAGHLQSASSPLGDLYLFKGILP